MIGDVDSEVAGLDWVTKLIADKLIGVSTTYYNE